MSKEKDLIDEFSEYLDNMSDEEFEKLVEECEKEFKIDKYGYIIQDHPPYLVGYERCDTMTLNEAILHAEEKAKKLNCNNESCGNEHKQLAKWLKELKELRKKSKLNFTELSDGYDLDSFTIEDIQEFVRDAVKIHKNLKGELVRRLETGKPFDNAPVGVNNPKAYKFLQKKLLKFAHMFEEDEMKFKLKKEKWKYIRDNEMPWTGEDIVDFAEIEQQIDYCRYNARLTRKRLEILEILRKEHLEM